VDEQFEGFGPILRRLRRAAGLTIAELAEASGVSPRAISDMERGHSLSPRRRTVAALAAALPPDGRSALSRAATRTVPDPAVLPAQSAPDLIFSGRSAQLDRLRQIARTALEKGTAPVAVISGPPGAGKTALAVRIAHAVAGWFSDGVHLVPAGTEPPAALYRARLEQRAVLMILDDVGGEAEVRPLLPPAGPALTIVTSRRLLTGLDGVHRLHLGPLPPDDAVRALSAMVAMAGVPLPAADAARVARHCDGLPLALRVAAGWLTGSPRPSPDRIAADLGDGTPPTADRVVADLSAGVRLVTEGPVADALDRSYRRLSPTAAELLPQLALLPGDAVHAETAARVAGISPARAEDGLDELVETSFLEAADGDRYHLPRLSRLFAEKLHAIPAPPARREPG
jgi:transcriptional regulator with XRE-family HTH domain